MHFIKEIIQGNPEKENIHRKFTRYSKGEFEGPRIEVKKKAGNLKIKASCGYEDLLGEMIARKTEDAIHAKGAIITRSDPSGFLSEIGLDVDAKKKKGVYTVKIDADLDACDLARIYSELEPAYALLSFKAGKETIKTKAKPPKPGSGADVQFCTASLGEENLKDILSEVFFEVEKEDFNEGWVEHTYKIEEIIIPPEYKNDHTKARLYAKKKGVLKRVVEVDGEKTEREYEFLV